MLQFLFSKTPLAFLTQSLWRDEAFSFFLAKKNLFDIVYLSARDFTPPLHPILLHFWLKLFGSSEIALRSLSLIFFSTTIYLIYLFIENVFRQSPQKSLLYVLLFIFNPFLLNYAFEVRAYSLLAFLATLSYYAYARKKYRLYLTATSLGLFTHYFMVFVLISHFIHNRLSHKSGRINKEISRMLTKPLYIFFPWFIYIFLQRNFFSTSFWLDKAGLKTFLYLPGTVYTGFEKNLGITSLILSLLLTYLLFTRIPKTSKEKTIILLLGLWGIFIPMLIAAVSLVKPIFFPRYFIFSTIGFLLLFVFLIKDSAPRAGRLIFLTLLIFALFYQNKQLQTGKKADFSALAKNIGVLAKSEDFIFVTNELDFFTAKFYFPGNKVYIFNKSYREIPDFVGKVLISKADIASNIPSYPTKTFIIKHDLSYTIQSFY